MHSFSCLFIFKRVFLIGKAAVLIFNSFFEVFTFLVCEALELINGGLIAAYGVLVASHCLRGLESYTFLLDGALLVFSAKADQIWLDLPLLWLGSFFFLLDFTASSLLIGCICLCLGIYYRGSIAAIFVTRIRGCRLEGGA